MFSGLTEKHPFKGCCTNQHIAIHWFDLVWTSTKYYLFRVCSDLKSHFRIWIFEYQQNENWPDKKWEASENHLHTSAFNYARNKIWDERKSHRFHECRWSLNSDSKSINYKFWRVIEWKIYFENTMRNVYLIIGWSICIALLNIAVFLYLILCVICVTLHSGTDM